MSRARDNANLSPTIADARMPDLTGDVTTSEGAVATTIADDAVDIAMLSATGTASSSTFLRGDNAWAAAAPRITDAFYHTLNGTGSSSTKIQKFTTAVDSSDDVVVTIGNSTTLGFTVTANMYCDVTMVYTCGFNGQSTGGISKNSTELTTGITDITVADKVAMSGTTANNSAQAITWRGRLATSDIIRPHIDGMADMTVPARGCIQVIAMEIL